jgi:hypothetical protein
MINEDINIHKDKIKNHFKEMLIQFYICNNYLNQTIF